MFSTYRVSGNPANSFLAQELKIVAQTKNRLWLVINISKILVSE